MDLNNKTISIIIPALNEADCIETTLSTISKHENLEVIVVDGGSRDGTADLARSQGATVLSAAPSKSGQMNCGAEAAGGDEEAGREKRESIVRKRKMLETSRRLGAILSKKK